MAEKLGAMVAKEMDLNIEIISRGLQTDMGTAHPNAVKTMERYGLDLKKHQSRIFSVKDYEKDTLILTMTDMHKQFLSSHYQNLNIRTLKEFAGLSGDIADPYGGSLAVYESCAKELLETIRLAMKKIK